jgi:hypothetical protein
MDDAMKNRLDAAVAHLTSRESSLEQFFQQAQQEQEARHAALQDRFTKLKDYLQQFVAKLKGSGHNAEVTLSPGKPFVDPGPTADPNDRDQQAAEWNGPMLSLYIRVPATSPPHVTFTGTKDGVKITRLLRHGVPNTIADVSDQNFTDELVDKTVVEFIEQLAAAKL